MLPKPVLKRSLKVSAVVGTTLTLINQNEAFFGDADFVIWKAVLTYVVPFVVSAYAAMTALADLKKAS